MANKIKMPGYDAKVNAEQETLAHKHRMEKTANDARRAAELAKAAAKLRNDKKKAIKKELPYTFNKGLLGGIHAIIAAAKIQLIAFAAGSAIFGLQHYDYENSDLNGDGEKPIGVELLHLPYQNTNSFSQAVKNVYLFDGFSDEQGGSGTFQAIVGLITMLIAVYEGGKGFKKGQEIAEDNNSYANRVYENLEQLKEYGINVEHLIYGVKDYAVNLVSKMSEMDRGYLDNLLNGGLENVNWDVANAIVAGHLKSHPEDYNEIIKIIDVATMDPELVKKYGKDGVTSFNALMAMKATKGNDK